MLFRPNRNLESELRSDPEFRAAMEDVGEELADAVREAAPDVTGAYKDSIEAAAIGDRFLVFTTDFAGHIVEWGSVNSQPYSPLRRGARSAGFRLEEH